MTARPLTLVEVGPRDGLQNEVRVLPVHERAHLIERLAEAGMPRIEAVSFVSASRVPQMADAEAVMAAVRRRSGTTYTGLVLNARGAERAVAACIDRINFVVVATETFNRRNQGCSVADSLAQLDQVAAIAARAAIPITGIVAASFGCPFEGLVEASRVVHLAEELCRRGAAEVVLADTIGAGVPTQVSTLTSEVMSRLPSVAVGGHFHNTRNTGLANAYAAYKAGASLLDASVGGAGGCPFAPNATGNIATEDVAYMFRQMGVIGSIDLEALVEIARGLRDQLGHEMPAMLGKAGAFPECVAATTAT